MPYDSSVRLNHMLDAAREATALLGDLSCEHCMLIDAPH